MKSDDPGWTAATWVNPDPPATEIDFSDSGRGDSEYIDRLEATIIDLKEMLNESFKYIDELERELLIPQPERWDLERLKKEFKKA